MRFVTIALITLVACTAVGSLVLAQAQQPGAPMPTPGGEGAGFGLPMGQPVPTSRIKVSLAYADPNVRMAGNNEYIGAIAYLASDPEMRKRADFSVPTITTLGGGFVDIEGVGAFSPVGSDVSIFVKDTEGQRTGIEVELTLQAPDKKDLLQTAAKRVVEGLSPSKLPKDERDKRVREIDEKIANIEDKKQLLGTVAANTAKLGPEILKDRIKAAELERQRLEMDLAAQRVRSDAIAKEIDRIRAQAEEKLQADAVLKQLREVVKLREEQRARVKQLFDTGQASQAALAEVDEHVMNANIRVTEREEAIRVSTNSSLLERLNAELASNMINRAEMEVRLEWIRRQQPSIDVKDLDEEKLNRLTDEYRALFRNPGTLPPLYYQLDKQQAELRVQKLALLISEVKAGEVSVTTQPAQ
jgi:hypothetical protein